MNNEECNSRSRQFTVRQSIFGKLVVMVRYARAENSIGMFSFGDWQYADETELPEVVSVLSRLNT